MKQASPESLSQHSVVTCVRDRVWRRESQGAVTHHGPVLTLPFFQLCAFHSAFHRSGGIFSALCGPSSLASSFDIGVF